MLAFKTSLAAAMLLIAAAEAGQNCKCQDPSGTGPQWDDETNQCCSRSPQTGCGQYPGPNHQCSARGTNCLDSGAFVECCQSFGLPGAYCWD